ncbi:MAG: GNAT family N-acetyltransferase [Tissierellia bacterium]|nr:GNAT family N-acetyltransferase [Tissierellia bacterium]
MKVVSIRANPELVNKSIEYFQEKWANENSMMVYDNSIKRAVNSSFPLPQWYLLMDGDVIVGCAGLITNDFISAMDLYPWLCALYIEEEYRGNKYSKLLIEKAMEDAKKIGFEKLYLSTDHDDLYEKFGFEYIGLGYHPWGESSKIYSKMLI